MTIYEILPEKTTTDNSTFTSFGIVALDEDSKEILCTVHDIFTEKENAENCVRLFNQSNLELTHLPQVIDEILQYPCIFNYITSL